MEQHLNSPRAWFITQRWQSYEGEVRAAVLRVAIVALFYGLQLVHHSFFSPQDEAAVLFHRQVTWLAAGYLCVSLGVLVALRQRFFPSGLKFVTCGFDLCLLTAAAFMGSGPASPLVVGYFVIVALATMRFSIAVIWFATLGSMVGYLLLVGGADPGWFDAEHVTPVIQQLMTLTALGASGVAAGQTIRMARLSAESYFQRIGHLRDLEEATKAEPTSSSQPAAKVEGQHES